MNGGLWKPMEAKVVVVLKFSQKGSTCGPRTAAFVGSGIEGMISSANPIRAFFWRYAFAQSELCISNIPPTDSPKSDRVAILK